MNTTLPADFISVDDVAAATGMTNAQLSRRFIAHDVPTFVHPLDRRSRVVKRAALDDFLAIRPVTPRREVRPT